MGRRDLRPVGNVHYDNKGNNRPLKAYDGNGQVHWLDARLAPKFPVVVIGASERVTGDPIKNRVLLERAKKGFSSGINQNSPITNIILPEDGGGGGGGGTPPPNPQPYANCRNDKQVEYLRSIWMKDVSEWEGWARGGPEIRVKIFFATSSNNGTVRSDGWDMSRGAIEDVWYCDNQLFYWDKVLIGNAVKFVWYEEDDNGTERTVNSSFESTVGGVKSTTSHSYTVKSGDEQIGESVIDFEFCPREKYYGFGGETARAFRWTQDSKPQ